MLGPVPRFMATLACVVGLLSASPTAAHADPTRNPGCKTVQTTQRYVLGVTAYGQHRTFRFCWTGGAVLSSRITTVRGTTDCWANGIFQERNCVGPTDRVRIRVSSSAVFTRGSGNIYFWFQSRDCATGPLKLLCSPWHWHGAKYTVKQGGGWFLADADV